MELAPVQQQNRRTAFQPRPLFKRTLSPVLQITVFHFDRLLSWTSPHFSFGQRNYCVSVFDECPTRLGPPSSPTLLPSAFQKTTVFNAELRRGEESRRETGAVEFGFLWLTTMALSATKTPFRDCTDRGDRLDDLLAYLKIPD